MDTRKTDNCKGEAHGHCREILNNVFRLLDGEMNEAEEQVFFSHVEKCPNCLEGYEIEKEFKEFICRKMNKKVIDPSLIESIRLQIKSMDVAKGLIFIAVLARLFTV